MGYTTDFSGHFEFDRPLKKEHADYLRAFSGSRRMKRFEDRALVLPDPVRLAADLPIGDDGGYYVGSSDQNQGQVRDLSIIDYNTPPCQHTYGGGDFNTVLVANQNLIDNGKCQPGLWCQWTVSEDGMKLEWDMGEKFYKYVAWLKYLINHFIDPWGYKLNGIVTYQGEDDADKGSIVVSDNIVTRVPEWFF